MPSSITQDKKLTVIFSLEAGCLGPEGENHIEFFCEKAEKELVFTDKPFIKLHFTPRHDTSQPEIHYQVNQKKLSREQANQYLKLFDDTVEKFEDELNNAITELINDYLQYS